VLVGKVAESMVDGEDGRGGPAATSTGEGDPADVASTGIGFVSEFGPDTAIESVDEGSVATAVAGGEGVWINGAFVGSVETTMGLKTGSHLGDRGGAMASSAFVVFAKLNEFGSAAGARALSSLVETPFDARLVLDRR
jgi:hypothetical protein